MGISPVFSVCNDSKPEVHEPPRLNVLHRSKKERVMDIFQVLFCCGAMSLNCKRSAVLLTPPLCYFHINIFTGTFFGNQV